MKTKDNEKELFPLVDEDGMVTGCATRGECHSGSRLLHPVVHLHVFNSRGELYLQQRPEWKDIQPGKWDTAVGGHVDYNEQWSDALLREAMEELGITDFTPEHLGKYVFDSKRERELVYVNRTTYDGVIAPSESELSGGRFWSIKDINDAIGRGILTPNFESEYLRFFGSARCQAKSDGDAASTSHNNGGVTSVSHINGGVTSHFNRQNAKVEGEAKYAMFFDIDGTLVSFKTHKIPASTIAALTEAKKNGHKVFIATGRPPLIITNLGDIEHLIDGYITTNGALCYVGDETVCRKSIPETDARVLVDDALAKGYSMIVVGERDVAVMDTDGEVDRIFRQEIAVENLDCEKPLDVVMQQRIMQITPFFTEGYEREMMMRIPGCTSGRWHPAFTDITARGADKGAGIMALAAHIGFNPEYTIAFGDGGNDTSMIRAAGIGVAMGNALEALKAEADYVTTSVDEDGVMNALRHFGIIS